MDSKPSQMQSKSPTQKEARKPIYQMKKRSQQVTNGSPQFGKPSKQTSNDSHSSARNTLEQLQTEFHRLEMTSKHSQTQLHSGKRREQQVLEMTSKHSQTEPRSGKRREQQIQTCEIEELSQQTHSESGPGIETTNQKASEPACSVKPRISHPQRSQQTVRRPSSPGEPVMRTLAALENTVNLPTERTPIQDHIAGNNDAGNTNFQNSLRKLPPPVNAKSTLNLVNVTLIARCSEEQEKKDEESIPGYENDIDMGASKLMSTQPTDSGEDEDKEVNSTSKRYLVGQTDSHLPSTSDVEDANNGLRTTVTCPSAASESGANIFYTTGNSDITQTSASRLHRVVQGHYNSGYRYFASSVLCDLCKVQERDLCMEPCLHSLCKLCLHLLRPPSFGTESCLTQPTRLWRCTVCHLDPFSSG